MNAGKQIKIFAKLLLTAVLFLAPLKFGLVITGTEVANFPLSVLEWLICPWPQFLMAVLGGLTLLSALAAYPRANAGTGPAWLIPGAWLLLFLTAITGLIRTTEWDVAFLFLEFLLGVFCLAAAALWMVEHEPGMAKWLLGAMAAAALVCCFQGWMQVPFGGLEDNREFLQQHLLDEGRTMPSGVDARFRQGRAFGSFVYPNSYAAHLLLTGPLLLLALWKAGGRVEPIRLSRPLFTITGLVLLLGALWFSRSRAAIIALFSAGIVAALICLSGPRWRRALLATVCLAVGAGAFLALSRGRARWATLEARTDYYTAAAKMFLEHPVTGVGLGEFFPNYMRMKSADAEETRMPHNVLLNFASQAGIAGFCAAAICLSIPLWMGTVFGKTHPSGDQATYVCVLLGLMSWGIHALADFNIHVPGSVITAACMPLICLTANRSKPGKPRKDEDRHGLPLRILLTGSAVLAVAEIWRIPGELHYQQLYAMHQQREIDIAVLRKKAEKTAKWRPFSPYPWMLVGRVCEYRSLHLWAAEAYEHAAARTPHRAAIFGHIARNRYADGDLDRARMAIAQALRWYPAEPRYRKLSDSLNPGD